MGMETKCDKGHDINAMIKNAMIKAATPPGEDWKLGSRLRAPCDSKEWDIALFTRDGSNLDEDRRRIIESKPTCPDFTDPTDEQIEADRKALDAVIERMEKLTPVIRKFKDANRLPGGTWRGNKTKETCPCCGKGLHMHISSYNGHVMGQCETEGCVSWME